MREKRSQVLILRRLGMPILAAQNSKDCNRCEYRNHKMNVTSHCYMFEVEPEGTACAQFTPGKGMMTKKDNYQKFREATMQNGGKPLLRMVKTEVDFDPSNPLHMDAVDLMFSPEPSVEDAKDDEKTAVREKVKELLQKRRAIPFRFKLVSPYMDVRSMVLGKTLEWAIELHKKDRA